MNKDKLLMIVDKGSFDSVASVAIANFAFADLKVLALDRKSIDDRFLKILEKNECDDFDRILLSGICFCDEDVAVVANNRLGHKINVLTNSAQDCHMALNFPYVNNTCALDDNQPQVSICSMLYADLINSGLLKNNIPALDTFTLQIDKEVNSFAGGTVAVEDLFDSMKNPTEFVNLIHRRLKFNIIRNENFKLNKEDSNLVDDEIKMLREYGVMSND